ncbi:hypothetical protein Ais01nite_33230 [Asanoa ishikariensis]|nr:hypothetical protein Ais01nite_33230 [Asanoa ishikariensis]
MIRPPQMPTAANPATPTAATEANTIRRRWDIGGRGPWSSSGSSGDAAQTGGVTSIGSPGSAAEIRSFDMQATVTEQPVVACGVGANAP